MNNIDKLKKISGEALRENVDLAQYTTMKVGGPARYLYVAKNIEELIKLVDFCQSEKIKFIVIGGGSNIVVTDEGYNGLAILNRASNIAFLSDKSQVIVDSGVSLMRLITESANRDFGGLEGLYGIPGTVGGAVYGNAGAHGTEICSLIRSVTVLTPENKIARFKKEWLTPEYRSTKLKQMKKSGKNIPIILSVTFQLTHHKKEEIMRKFKEYMQIRNNSQPYDKPSAGSIFKNVGIEKEKSAGFILESVGAKKLKIGGAEVSKKHANFIINTNNATAKDIKELIEKMSLLAHDKFGVELEEEIEIIS
jgi:UDP-N-acetylmuramate dehydrogenase